MDCGPGAALGRALSGMQGMRPQMMGGPMGADFMDDMSHLDNMGIPDDVWANEFGQMHPQKMPPPPPIQMMAPGPHFDDWSMQFEHMPPMLLQQQHLPPQMMQCVPPLHSTQLMAPPPSLPFNEEDALFNAAFNDRLTIRPHLPEGEQWVQDFRQAQERMETQLEGEKWAAQMQAEAPPLNELDQAWNDATNEDLEKAWEGSENDPYGQEFVDTEQDQENWAEEYQEMLDNFEKAQLNADYPFDPDNPYLFHDNPFEEGLELLGAGILSDAVLAFEAVCQKQPDYEEAWRLLGTTQAENEKDKMAILALNKARQLDPTDAIVHISLAVSHANEGNQTFALNALKGWILAHPEYEALGNLVNDMPPPEMKPVEEGEEFSREFLVNNRDIENVITLFSAAIEMTPHDPDLYIGLGIVNHLAHEFDEAAVRFRKALELRPEDAKLWNKLGATLANGNRSFEAIDAYNRALDLNPGYVRAQYNMGIAHNNLGEPAEAARDFCRSIVMQQGGPTGTGMGGEGEGKPSRATRELWDVLRMALNLMNRSDLVEMSWKQDLRPILNELGLTDLQ